MRYLPYCAIAIAFLLIMIGHGNFVLGQSYQAATHVVINEADINPVGDDTLYPIDWVELYNPGGAAVDVSGWTVSATTGLRMVYTLPSGSVMQSKQFLVLTDGPMWFPHAGAVIQLKNSTGTVIDQTPPLTDLQGGGGSWQRMYDGLDTGSSSDWVYKTATPGSSNGQPSASVSSAVNTMTVNTDKPSYVLGDTVAISGKVSSLLTDPTLGYPLPVNLAVTGPNNFQKKFTLYPGNNMGFSTTMTTSQVTGFSEGNYTITASYGTVGATATFALGTTQFVPPPQSAPVTISISTDQPSYIPLQPITLSGSVSQVIPLTPLVYKVYDPSENLIYQGNLYPDTSGHFSTYSPFQEHSSASGIMINNITPAYGTYSIIATYGTAKSTLTFKVVQQQVQSAPLLINTDKPAYGLGDTVHISGSTQLAGLQNSGLSPTLEIVQSSAASMVQGIMPQTLDIKTFVNVQPDNTFSYNFTIPNDPVRLGNYRAIISTSSEKSEADFAVVQNPNTYQPAKQGGPLMLYTDKTSYAYGDPIVISGQVQASMIIQGVQVQIAVYNSTGGQLYSQTSFLSGAAISQSTPLSFSAYPDSSGNYLIKQSLTPGMFTSGTYTLKASYGNLQASTTFSVYNPLETGSQGAIAASLDKQVYGVGDTVHLTGKIASTTGTSAFTLNLLKPDGGVVTVPLSVNNGFFNWNWTVPSRASFNTVSTFTTNRAASFNATSKTDLYGIYMIGISSDYGSSRLYFQVSPNPQNQTAITPFTVETDKTTYSNSDVVNISGQVLPQPNTASQNSNSQVQLSIYTQTGQEAYRYGATLNQGGQFHLSVPLQPGVWAAGTYKVYAQYLNYADTTTFQVTNPYVISSGPLRLLMTTDHDQYLPGQTVLITGRTSYIISVNNVYLTIGLANDTVVSEGQVVSQSGKTLQHGMASFDQYGSFSYNYKIPQSSPTGNYTVVAQVPFGNFNAYYQVVSHLPVQNVTSGVNATAFNATRSSGQPQNATVQYPTMTTVPESVGPIQKAASPSQLVVKQGMIPDSVISISIGNKTEGNATYYPEEIDGLLRVNPGDENAVNLKVTSPDGTCVIGPAQACEISQSTLQASPIYRAVKIGNETLLVGYSGPDQRVQQFSIIPAEVGVPFSAGQWQVNVLKTGQISRFYYDVTYDSR
ncbi:MAG: lamin tail domain-containing protein [Thaumarchaeota archaeon]|nr:lamin tail domain-containing protein [Nitrososphaerota archaeon]